MHRIEYRDFLIDVCIPYVVVSIEKSKDCFVYKTLRSENKTIFYPIASTFDDRVPRLSFLNYALKTFFETENLLNESQIHAIDYEVSSNRYWFPNFPSISDRWLKDNPNKKEIEEYVMEYIKDNAKYFTFIESILYLHKDEIESYLKERERKVLVNI